VTLHACYDLPLLTLQQHPEIVGLGRRALEGAGMLFGFGTIALAARLVRRIGAHHAPHTDVSRQRLAHLRGMWALTFAGGAAGFAGTAFLVSSVQHWYSNPERSMTMVLVPLGFTSIAIGVVLLVLTSAAYFLGRNRMRTAAPAMPVQQ